MGEVTNIDDYRPYFCVQGITDIHVLPKTFLMDIVSGKCALPSTEMVNDALIGSIKDWLGLQELDAYE